MKTPFINHVFSRVSNPVTLLEYLYLESLKQRPYSAIKFEKLHRRITTLQQKQIMSIFRRFLTSQDVGRRQHTSTCRTIVVNLFTWVVCGQWAIVVPNTARSSGATGDLCCLPHFVKIRKMSVWKHRYIYVSKTPNKPVCVFF